MIDKYFIAKSSYSFVFDSVYDCLSSNEKYGKVDFLLKSTANFDYNNNNTFLDFPKFY
jgi:hypothetical protein